MTTPTFVLEGPVSAGTVVELTGDSHHHLVRVLRLTSGASLTGLVAGTGTAQCFLLEATERHALVRIDEVFVATLPEVELTLVASPLKHKGTADYVAFAGEVGVHRVLLAPMRRSVAKLEPEQVDRYQRIATEAARGIGQPIIPKVEVARSLDHAIQSAAADRLFFFWEDGGEPITSLRLEGKMSVAFVVGPEGGFDAIEAVQLQQRGASALHMQGPLYRAGTAIVLGTTLLLQAAKRI